MMLKRASERLHCSKRLIRIYNKAKEIIMNSSSVPTIAPAISVLYWRQNLWNAAQCVPVVLQLDADGMFSMRTADKQVVFSAPIRDVQPRFTGWGTMILTIADTTYALVGVGATDSPRPADWQVEMLQNAAEAANPNGSIAGTAGVGAATVGSAVGQGLAGTAAAVGGAVVSQVAFHRGLGRMRDWQEVFVAAGLSFRRNSMNYMAIFVGTVVGVVVLLVIVGSIR
jgi:hypothetical protein